MDSNNLSGCIIYKNTVVCTHLDVNTTRFILNRLEYNRTSISSSFGSPFAGRGRVDPRSDFVRIHMLREDVNRFIKERNNMFPPSSATSAYAQSPFGVPSRNPPEEEEEDSDGYVQLGLYILSLNELSVAIILRFHALYDKEHMKKFLKLSTDLKLQTLESDLDSVWGGNLANVVNNNTRIVSSSAYHLITYDGQTQAAMTTIMNSPQEYEFAQAASMIHHTFHVDDNSGKPPHAQVSQVIVRDCNGEIFARKIFGREVYFQYKNGTTFSHDKFLEGIEKSVKTTLKEEHNINIL